MVRSASVCRVRWSQACHILAGFVRFRDENECNAAIVQLNGTPLYGRNLRISAATDRKTGTNASAPGAGAGSSGGASGLSMMQMQQQQSVLSASVFGGAPAALMSALAGAQAAAARVGPGAGAGVAAGVALDPSEDPTNTTVFVGGLDSNATLDQLRAPFEAYGELQHVKIAAGKNCGFVTFAHRMHAETALQVRVPRSLPSVFGSFGFRTAIEWFVHWRDQGAPELGQRRRQRCQAVPACCDAVCDAVCDAAL